MLGFELTTSESWVSFHKRLLDLEAISFYNFSVEQKLLFCGLCTLGSAPFEALKTFVDVEGTKEVKRMINLLAITVNLYHEIDADPSGSGSKTDRVRKQMLIKDT